MFFLRFEDMTKLSFTYEPTLCTAQRNTSSPANHPLPTDDFQEICQGEAHQPPKLSLLPVYIGKTCVSCSLPRVKSFDRDKVTMGSSLLPYPY